MDLQKMIDDAFVKMHDDGVIEQKVTAAVSSMIDQVLKDVMGRYGAMEKEITALLTTNLKLSLEHIKLPAYSQAVIEVIDPILRDSVLTKNINRIKERIHDITGVVDGGRVKLSEIVTQFIEEVISLSSEDEGEITLIIQTSNWGTTYIYFDEDSYKNALDCKYSMAINKAEDGCRMWHLEIKGKPVSIIDKAFDLTHGFKAYLFNLYANGVAIDIDECNIYWSKLED